MKALLISLFAVGLLATACGSGSPPGPTPTPAPPEVIARGEEIFQRTAGGVGCASCHGREARGGAGVPNIVGRPASDIQRALRTVGQMSFIKLSDEEIEAVAAYLQTLRTR
jgi:mono/diheme cytochrome c family protein